MSRRERVIAALLLAVAVVGGAVMPRLLASPATALGIALGPSPRPSVVQAPTIPQAPRHANSGQPTSSVTPRPVVSSAPAVPVVVRPKPAAAAQPKHVQAPSPAPPAKTAPPV